MSDVVRDQLARLAAALTDLKARVRAAVAGELARHVADAVRHVVQALAAGPDPGRVTPPDRRPASRWDDDDPADGWDRPAGRWDDPDENDGRYAPYRPARPDPAASPRSHGAGGLPVAVAAGVTAARWWLARRGSAPAAAGVGLAVGLAGALGGPGVRAAVAALAAAADLLAATDTVGGADPPDSD